MELIGDTVAFVSLSICRLLGPHAKLDNGQ